MAMRMMPRGRTSVGWYALERFPVMSFAPDVSGTAALAIVESLLLALNDHKILPETEILGILKDAAAAREILHEAAGQW